MQHSDGKINEAIFQDMNVSASGNSFSEDSQDFKNPVISENHNVGIISYGVYLPASVLLVNEIAAAHDGEVPSLGVLQKTVADADEDTATLAVASAWQCMQRFQQLIWKQKIGSLWIGSESHPYAVKATGTMVAAALGLPKQLAAADLQFACKAGTQALQIAVSSVLAGTSEISLAIGADTAQSRPGDVLEYTAAAGAAAYAIGTQNVLCRFIDTLSYATDTPDFWRKPGEEYPQHAGRFTGEPAYFSHIEAAVTKFLQKRNLRISEIDHVIFHTPNGKFPLAIAKKLGVRSEQMQWSIPVKEIGNTYAAATLIAFAHVLDHAAAGQTILVASYGSGAGSDVFLWETTTELEKLRSQWADRIDEQIQRMQPISYREYQRRQRANNHEGRA